MAVETVGDLFTRADRTDRPALEDAGGRVYDAHWVRTSAWKAGNFLRHSGVRNGVTVGIVGGGPKALLSFFGTALLEGRTRFDPPVSGFTATNDRLKSDSTNPMETSYRALVAPVGAIETYEVPPNTQRIGYGGEPDDPAVHHLESGLWSENPTFPPVSIDPETPLLTDGDRSFSHAEAIQSAREVVDTYDIDASARVVAHVPFSDPRAVIASVLAPLLSNATCVLSADSTGTDGANDTGAGETSPETDRGTHVVTNDDRGSVPEPTRIDLEDVPL